jgi:hypothetical protein
MVNGLPNLLVSRLKFGSLKMGQGKGVCKWKIFASGSLCFANGRGGFTRRAVSRKGAKIRKGAKGLYY